MKEHVISLWCRIIVRGIGILMVGYLFLQVLFTICCIQRIEEKTFFIKNNTATQFIGIVLFAFLVWVLNWEKMQTFLEKFGKYIVAVLHVFLFCWCCATSVSVKCQYVIPYAYLGYAEMVGEIGKAGKGWNRVYTIFLVLGILIAFIAISDAERKGNEKIVSYLEIV